MKHSEIIAGLLDGPLSLEELAEKTEATVLDVCMTMNHLVLSGRVEPITTEITKYQLVSSRRPLSITLMAWLVFVGIAIGSVGTRLILLF